MKHIKHARYYLPEKLAETRSLRQYILCVYLYVYKLYICIS